MPGIAEGRRGRRGGMDDNDEDNLVLVQAAVLYTATPLRSERVDFEEAAHSVITLRLNVKLQIALFIMVVRR
jgi:hypothetical protein